MRDIGFKEKISNDCVDVLVSISNNVMIDNLINDLINYNGVTNFFCKNIHGNKYYEFFNDKKDKACLYIRPNDVFVKNNFDGNNHEICYHLNNDGSVVIDIGIYSKVDYPNYSENRTVCRTINYDSCGNLVSDKKTVTSYLSSNDIDMDKQLKESLYENYKVTTSVYLVDNKLFREKVTNYFGQPDFEKHEYSVSDYEVGMLGSGDSSKYDNPKFSSISEEKFIEMTNSNDFQKVKLFA